MNEKILVLGATGAVGTYLVKELMHRNAKFRVGVRTPSKLAQHNSKAFEVVAFDFADSVTFDVALDEITRVFLVTPPPSLHPQELNLCAPFIDAAARAGVRQMVRLSSMWALHSPASSHRRIEQYIEATMMPYTHLRPNIFMQNFNLSQRVTIQNEHCVRVSAGMGRVTFIDIRDIAACAAVVLTTNGHEGRAYTLTGPESLSYADAAAALSRAIGQTIRYDSVSDTELRMAYQAANWPGDLIDYVSHLYQAVPQGYRQDISTDLTDLIGRPTITFERYTLDHVDQWR